MNLRISNKKVKLTNDEKIKKYILENESKWEKEIKEGKTISINEVRRMFN